MINRFASRAATLDALADQIASDLRDAIASRGRASLSVPGGTTPKPLFERLREVDLEWAKVDILLNDERFVPETSDRSNTRLIKETLLQSKASAANYIPMVADAERPEDVLSGLAPAIDAILPLDVLLLGMGGDMHTASLFPEADLLDQALSDDAPILLPMRAAGAGEPRITLSAPVLKKARHSYVLIFGDDKMTALNRALEDGPEAKAPIRVVLKTENPAQVYWAE